MWLRQNWRVAPHKIGVWLSGRDDRIGVWLKKAPTNRVGNEVSDAMTACLRSLAADISARLEYLDVTFRSPPIDPQVFGNLFVGDRLTVVD